MKQLSFRLTLTILLFLGTTLSFGAFLAGCNQDNSSGSRADISSRAGVNSIEVEAKSLANNLLQESSKNSVLIYLPPSYESNLDKRYPTLYLLHGNGISNQIWIENPMSWNIGDVLDQGIKSGALEEMIVVMPNAYNTFHGSQYVNSETTGDWEEYITDELMEFVDENYRTINDSNKKALAGHSMGAKATLYFALRHPLKYVGFYALSAGVIGFDDYASSYHDAQNWIELSKVASFDEASSEGKKLISFAAAFSPNPKNPPFYADFPYVADSNETVIKKPITWARWVSHDPFALAGAYVQNLQKISNFHFECGLQDPFFAANQAMSEQLTQLDINHTFSSFTGDHTDHLFDRVQNGILPYFSKIFSK